MWSSACAGLLIGIGSLAHAAGECAAGTDNWKQTQQDLLWTTELDAGAKECTRKAVIDDHINSVDAVFHCNKGLQQEPARSRWFLCGAEACNWLKARQWTPAC
jgi:hypothetical protein